MNLAIGSAVYAKYSYNRTDTGTGARQKAERLSVGVGKLTQEMSRQQGRRYAAVSKQGDTLEISQAARRLLEGEPEEAVKTSGVLSAPADMQKEVIEPEVIEVQEDRHRNIATFDFRVSDDTILNNLA